MMIWSRRSPDSSASSVDCTADSTMHSLMMSSELRPELAVGVLLHLRDDELLVERAAVHADPDRLAAIARDAADRGELLVAPLAGADVAGIDAVLVQRLRALREARQQQVAVVVEVADERRRHAGVEHAPLDLGDGRGGLGHVDGHAHHLGAGLGELDALLSRARGIGRVGHRHRLDHDGRAAADLDRTDPDADSLVELDCVHVWPVGL